MKDVRFFTTNNLPLKFSFRAQTWKGVILEMEKKIFGDYKSASSHLARRDYKISGGVLALAVLKILY